VSIAGGVTGGTVTVFCPKTGALSIKRVPKESVESIFFMVNRIGDCYRFKRRVMHLGIKSTRIRRIVK
jgi:hypothetical protein